jgi:hypothetical protein
VTVAAHQPATADLRVRKAADIAAQLSNAEWIASVPGTDQQKAILRPCSHCHTLERIMRSRHTADEMVRVIQRMATYPQLSFPLKIQKLPAPRVGAGVQTEEQRQAAWRRQAEYLATINLSSGPQWSYELKTLPRPTGKATDVIYTEYDLPQRTRQPHDVIVDSKGLAWYASFGEQILGRLDPRTAPSSSIPSRPETGGADRDPRRPVRPGRKSVARDAVSRWHREVRSRHRDVSDVEPASRLERSARADQPGESRSIASRREGVAAGRRNLHGAATRRGVRDVRGVRAVRDPETERLRRDSRFAEQRILSGAGSNDVGRIDAKTGAITIFKTPTAGSGPRRGMMDASDRLWFGENNGDRIGMFDTRTRQFQEWPAPTPGAWPYDVTIDKEGSVWSGGEFNDRILRLDPKSGRFLEYLLPRRPTCGGSSSTTTRPRRRSGWEAITAPRSSSWSRATE